MSKLRISAKRLEGLYCIAKLNDKATKELFAALASLPLRLYPTESTVFKEISDKVTSIKDKDALLILDTLISMQHAHSTSNTTLNTFVKNIITSVDEQRWPDDTGVEREQLTQLEKNVEKLLKVPSLSLAIKATSLLFESERSLLNSRILTDIRPVFDVLTNDIGGGLIIQTLKLEYISDEDDSSKEFFVSLDSDDIDDLIDNLERAKAKAGKLKELLAASSIQCIDTSES